MKNNMFKFIVPVLMLVSMVTACGSKSEKTAEAETPATEEKVEDMDLVGLTEAQFKTVDVQYGALEEKNLSSVTRASGEIEAPPQQLNTISSPYGGVVKTISVLEGKLVSKGQVIAVIENPEFIQLQQDYLDLKSQLVYQKEELDRQEELAKENVNSKKTVQKASSDFNSLVARVEGIKSKLRLININPDRVTSQTITSRANVYCNVPGYVTKVTANVGKYVAANEALAEVADTRELHVELMVFEKDVPKLQVGQKVRFVLNNETEERFAEISLIGREISTDRTVRVHCKLKTEDKDLLPGMYLKGVVETGMAKTLALPDAAIVQAAGKSYIFIASDTPGEEVPKEKTEEPQAEKHIGFKRIEVTTGVSENGYTEVTVPAQFDKNSKVVIKGAYDLLSKMNNVEEEE